MLTITYIYFRGNAALMKINLFQYGPLVVDFKIHYDFRHYKSGVYQHVDKKLVGAGRFDPYESVTHAVLIVGYGTDTSDLSNPIDYWIVKNSWGKDWGDNGYIKFKRGTNECSIESASVQAFPVI